MPKRGRYAKAYGGLIDLAALAIVLQGLWAGIFLQHDGRRLDETNWIHVHARGGEVALALTAIATVLAFVKMRERKPLWIGGASLVVLIVVESYIGGLIYSNGKFALTILHVPLALCIMSMAVWLSLRSRR